MMAIRRYACITCSPNFPRRQGAVIRHRRPAHPPRLPCRGKQQAAKSYLHINAQCSSPEKRTHSPEPRAKSELRWYCETGPCSPVLNAWGAKLGVNAATSRVRQRFTAFVDRDPASKLAVLPVTASVLTKTKNTPFPSCTTRHDPSRGNSRHRLLCPCIECKCI